ncbi:nuclear transcription factor Y subunit gamma-like isoform X4 [Apostichopus japonicus]|uniref:nuclear transcription factor Y subunit gamma-like isoform X4 n=1 Tax=Stichopus japonicus TaxID=307972 RepID=UPI003AB69E68
MDTSRDAADTSPAVPSEAQLNQQSFWQKHLEMIRALKHTDFRTQELPLARIKKIMKLDEDVKMISAEAPVLFSKAAEIFIAELSLRAWLHTEDNKRRTLQRNDIAMAITKYDQFDFLIDIVPRDELKPQPKRPEAAVAQTTLSSDQAQYFLQFAQNQGTMIQIQTPTSQASGTTASTQASQLSSQPQYITVSANPATGGNQLQTVQQVSAVSTDAQSSGTTTQLVTSGGQTIPIQLPAGSIQQLVSNAAGTEVPQLQINQQGGIQIVRPQGVTLQQANGQQQINAQDLVAQLTGQQQQVFQIQQLPLQSQAGQTQQVFLSGATTDTTVSIADQ